MTENRGTPPKNVCKEGFFVFRLRVLWKTSCVWTRRRHNRLLIFLFPKNFLIGQEEKGGHGAILQYPGNRVILVFSDMLSTKIDVGALDFTGLIFYRPSKWRHNYRPGPGHPPGRVKNFFFKCTYIIYHSKGNFMLIKSPFGTYIRKWTGQKLYAVKVSDKLLTSGDRTRLTSKT